MNILSAVLAATLALDGGVDQLYVACPPSDVPLAVQTDAGTWTVPDLRMRRTNCRLAACEQFAGEHLEPAAGSGETVVAPPLPVWLAIGASVVATLGLGIYIGVKADQAVRP